jgi:glycosyltransferase involved in cell wall biosynthesis
MAKEAAKISVLMSVYNDEDFLSASIESILAQTFPAFEFIIINDGSSDRSPGIIHDYAVRDKRIKVIDQDNIGLTQSLNKGLSIAEGTYVARQDGGDISLPERLSLQNEFLDNHPDVSLLGTSISLIDENNRVIRTKIQPTEIQDIKKILPRKNCFSHGSLMFRRSEVKNLGGYRNNLLLAQDYDLILRISEKYDLCNLKDILYQQRMNRKAISVEKATRQRAMRNYIRSLAQQRSKDGVDDLEKGNFEYIDKLSQIKRSSKKAADAEYHARLAHEYFAGDKPKEAIEHYIKSLKFAPLRIKNWLLLSRAVLSSKKGQTKSTKL